MRTTVLDKMASTKTRCPLCESFAAPHMKGVVRHIGLVHSHEAGFRVTCGIGTCTRAYSNFSSYKKHMYVKHRDILDVSPREQGPNVVDSNPMVCLDSSEDEQEPCITERDRSTALFILKCREVHKIPQSSLDYLLGDISTIIDMTNSRFIQSVAAALREKGIEMEDELQALSSSPEVSDPFKNLHSEYLQRQYFIRHFNLVEPVEIRLGRNIETVVRRSRRCHQISWNCGYYVPLLSSLQQFLSDDTVLSEVLTGHARQDGLLSDYCDGSAYKSHSLFSRTSCCLEVILYYDDVEVCNPLGSRAKTHKLALFYYTLGNLSPKYRSSLQSIQLLIAVKSNLLVRYGADKILKPVLEEIKQLESDSGVTLSIRGSEYTFRGTISLFPADNLASQYVGGYKALNAALRKCRICLAVQEDMQSQFLSEAFRARTRETHTNHCSGLGGPLHNHYATTYGLHRDSSLNTLQYFHVTEGLIPDIMHDCLEGCVQYEVKELLKYLSSEGVLSVSAINTSIQSFPFSGPDARNRPSPITAVSLTSSDHALKQTATQMWCLARLLPLMIGNKISTDNEYWCNFLLLLEMLDYIFAPTLTSESVAHLKILIDDHHQAFRKLYPSCPIIPKMHYIVHYPELILRYGPLVRSWCMRFEGKHSYFKDLAHRVKCFKNIPLTLASRHQRLVCYRFAASNTGHSALFKETTFGRVTTVDVSSLEYKEECETLFPEATHVSRSSWVEICGTKYSLKNVVVLDCGLLPEFGIIHDVVLNDVHQPFLVCEKLTTQCYSSHYHAYEVLHPNPPSYCIYKQSELYDYSVLSQYHVHSSLFVSLKYFLVEKLH